MSLTRRRGTAVGALLFVVTVIGGSVGLLAWQRARAESATSATRTPASAEATTVLDLAPRLAPATLSAPVSVAIVRDTATDHYYETPATMDSIVAAWQSALRVVGAEARVMTPVQALASDAQVVVVPASPCLGRDTRHALELATRRGRGLIVTWLSGLRDGGCKRVGYGLIAAMSGASRVDTLESGRSSSFVTFLRAGPLTADIPPGARIELDVANHVVLRAPGREAYFSDFMLNPRTRQGVPLLDAAVAQRTIGASRAVYWGFDLSRVAPHRWDREVALRLVRNSVAWAAGLPVVTLEPWPNGKTAAVVIAQDVEDEFSNGRFALDSLRAAGVPGTYFLVSQLALRDRALVRDMAAQGEIGSHTPRHRLLGGNPAAIQAKMLDDTQRELAEILGHRDSGLRPPEEQFDASTLVEWSKTGGRYVFASNDGRQASPEILSVDGHAIVVLGRVINDDFVEVARAGITDVDSLARQFLVALEKVRALGGLYILSYHSQMLSRPELVPALARVARTVAGDSALWTTTAGAVADWWIGRSLVSVQARFGNPRQLRLEVRNDGELPVRNAVVRVALGTLKAAAIEGAVRLADEDGALRILLPPLPHGVVHAVTVSLASDAQR
jgi:peptidoglycan/xylan/chitin deacetylase (PgdA/CDA1 family)